MLLIDILLFILMIPVFCILVFVAFLLLIPVLIVAIFAAIVYLLVIAICAIFKIKSPFNVTAEDNKRINNG